MSMSIAIHRYAIHLRVQQPTRRVLQLITPIATLTRKEPMRKRLQHKEAEKVAQNRHDGDACHEEAAIEEGGEVVVRVGEGVGRVGARYRVRESEEWDEEGGQPVGRPCGVHANRCVRIAFRLADDTSRLDDALLVPRRLAVYELGVKNIRTLGGG